MPISKKSVRRSTARIGSAPLALWGFVNAFSTPAPRLLPVRVRTRRGAGMLEYALIALISIGVFVALNEFFPDFFQGILDNIQDQFDDTQ
jgi:hypothetical protein